jgi:hypothetical protein
VPMEAVVEFAVNSLEGLLYWGLDNDLPYSPREMNDLYPRLAEPGIRSALVPRPDRLTAWPRARHPADNPVSRWRSPLCLRVEAGPQWPRDPQGGIRWVPKTATLARSREGPS